jgi:SAM-dependent methyltransferase
MRALASTERLSLEEAPRARAQGVPLVRACIAQAAGGVAVAAQFNFAAAPMVEPMLLQGLVAAAVGQTLRMPVWWLPINAAFVPAAVGLRSAAISPAWFLAAFAVLLILFWNTFRTRVPLYLSSACACERLAGLLPDSGPARVLDLGCGFGGVMMSLRRLRPDLDLVGMETAPLPSWLARLRLRRDSRSTVVRRDFWQEDLRNYDLVYAFLSPEPMERLWQKVCSQMAPGSLFVSNSFIVPGVAPDLTLPVRGGSVLYVWQVRG